MFKLIYIKINCIINRDIPLTPISRNFSIIDCLNLLITTAIIKSITFFLKHIY